MVNVPPQFQPVLDIAYPPYGGAQMNIEQYFHHSWLKWEKSGMLERCLRPGTRTYLPVFWTHYYLQHCYGKNIEELNTWLDGLSKDRKYFTICQYDDGVLYTPKGMDLLVFSAGGQGDVPIPLLAQEYPVDGPRPLHERRHMASFVGHIGTHPIRQRMAERLKKKPGIFIHDSADALLHPKQYFEIMQDSIFSLCPRGYGKSSFRLYEAIHAGSIPVYISDEHWLSWKDEGLDKFIVIDDGIDYDYLYKALTFLNVSGAPFWWMSQHSWLKAHFSMHATAGKIFDHIQNKS